MEGGRCRRRRGCGVVSFLFISSNLARNTFALGARELSLTLALGTPRRSRRSLARSNALRHHITLAVAYQSMIPKPVPSSRPSEQPVCFLSRFRRSTGPEKRAPLLSFHAFHLVHGSGIVFQNRVPYLRGVQITIKT
jgi:hypothetical protein